MRVAGFRVEKERIVVLPHAVRQARLRIRGCRGNDSTVIEAIRSRVAEGALNSVYDSKPREFRGRGERKRPLPPGQRLIVWRDSAFVVDVAMLPTLTVVTSYNKLDRSYEVT